MSEPDIFGLPSFFFLSCVFWIRIFSRIKNLTFQAHTTTLENKYSYPNAVKRSIKTSSTPLIILINGSRLRLLSLNMEDEGKMDELIEQMKLMNVLLSKHNKREETKQRTKENFYTNYSIPSSRFYLVW